LRVTRVDQAAVTMTRLPKRLLILGVLVCTGALAQPAAAQVQPAGTGEPAYTNSQQNKQWFEWPATSGADGYRVKFSHYGTASASTLKVTLAGKARKARASTAGLRAPRVSSAGAPVALPDGRFHGKIRRSFAPRALVAR